MSETLNRIEELAAQMRDHDATLERQKKEAFAQWIKRSFEILEPLYKVVKEASEAYPKQVSIGDTIHGKDSHCWFGFHLLAEPCTAVISRDYPKNIVFQKDNEPGKHQLATNLEDATERLCRIIATAIK